MQATFGCSQVEFRPWRPADGLVFPNGFAFDCETTRIDDTRHWLTPAYVLGAGSDGQRGVFVQRRHLGDFLLVHVDSPIVLHNAPFDLAVMQQAAPHMDVYAWVDGDLVFDTRLLHRLLVLGTEGSTARGPGKSTLEQCVRQHLGADLPKDVMDSRGNPVRLSYGQWLGKPPSEIEPVYLHYLAADVLATWELFGALCDRLEELKTCEKKPKGFVSTAWLDEQAGRWGPQTHHTQLRGAIALQQVSANGLSLDRRRRDELLGQLDVSIGELKNLLREHGYLPGEKGSDKALQGILRDLERQRPGRVFPRTATGKFATSQKVISDLAAEEPFLQTLLQFTAATSLRETFAKKLVGDRIHPTFDVLGARSGRTSSFGEINAQNLPRDDRLRGVIVPSAGRVFIQADYAVLELCTLAEACERQFDLPSAMAAAINQGKDLHRLFAAKFTGKPESDVTSDERQKAKVFNFGKPGGLGDEGVRKFAQSSYGVDLTDDEVQDLTNEWLSLFPEMNEFLDRDDDSLFDVAEFFHLTPSSLFEHTGSRSFLDHPNNHGHEDEPHPILGGMMIKVLGQAAPCKTSGEAYTAVELDFFWTQAEQRAECFPATAQQAIERRQPSRELRRAVQTGVGRGGVYTLTGRLRANAAYTERLNTIFQGLAADGAKRALYRLFRAGFRVVNFIHDEVLVEVPETAFLGEQAEAIRQHLVNGMKEVVTEIAIRVEVAASRRWSKSAEAVLNAAGQLVPWEPADQTVEGAVVKAAVNGRATEEDVNE